MSKKYFNLTFPSQIYRVKRITRDIVIFLKSSLPGICERDLSDLRLIYSELLCNAVIHGNKNDPRKRVTITVELDGNMVYSVISDEGCGFDYISLLSEAGSEASLAKDRGRGILLVYSLTDSIIFNIYGNELKFYKKVNTDG